MPISHIITRTLYIHRNPFAEQSKTDPLPVLLSSFAANGTPAFGSSSALSGLSSNLSSSLSSNASSNTSSNASINAISSSTHDTQSQYVPSYTNPLAQTGIYGPDRIVIDPLDHFTFTGFAKRRKHNLDEESTTEPDNEESDYKDYKKDKHTEPGVMTRVSNTITRFFQGFTIMKMLILCLVVFLGIAIGYQLRKSEERSNYVRLPATQ